MDTPHEHALHVGVARVALRLAWTATMSAPEAVFGDSQLVMGRDTSAEVLDEQTAAERLVTAPRPLVLRAEEQSIDQLRVLVNAVALDHSPGDPLRRALEFLGQMGERPILILAAGQAYRLSSAAVGLLVRDYRFAVPLGGGGGPPEDLWTQQLQLPGGWLSGCGFGGSPGDRKEARCVPPCGWETGGASVS